ncbi:MAG: type II secretion system GspH family protein [Candidatus Pacebacteria bacterium]|jgi:type II secretory pathway pseudopilin PulG|nr:type II secretion system GspH family protein [Candidatus Paceibacterota bacterium]
MKNTKRQSGFTLIEATVYLALFGVIFSGIIAAAYLILETSGKNHARAMMQEEGEFLMAKINLAVSCSKSSHINDPQTLMVTAWDGATSTIAAAGGNLVRIVGAHGAELNNGNTLVDSLSFAVVGSENGVAGIEYRFDLVSRSPGGANLISRFGSTAYIRK